MTQPDLYQPLTTLRSDATLAAAITQLDHVINSYSKQSTNKSTDGCQSFLEKNAAIGETLIACFELITNCYAAYRQQHLTWFVTASTACIGLVYRINHLKFEDMQFPEVRSLRRSRNPNLIFELAALAIITIAAISLARASTEDELNLSFITNVLSISCSITADMFEINSPWSSLYYYQSFCALKFVFSTMSCGFILAITFNLCDPSNNEKLADPGQCFNHVIGQSGLDIAILLFATLGIGATVFSGYAFSAKVFLQPTTELTWPVNPRYFSYIAPTLTALVTAIESAAGGAEGLTDYLHHNNKKDLSAGMILITIAPLFAFAFFAATKKVNALMMQMMNTPVSITQTNNASLHSMANQILESNDTTDADLSRKLYALRELQFILKGINQPDITIQDVNPNDLIPALRIFTLPCEKLNTMHQEATYSSAINPNV